MGDDVAFGVRAARVRTWIFTAFPNAGLVLWTIVAEHTLWTAIWRAADVIFDARANWSTLGYLANGIRAAWRW